jgi:hypothetical protein
MNKKAKNASSKCADEQDAGEAMDSAAVREQPNQGDEFLLALGKFGSHLEEGLRLKKRKRDKNQLNINSYFGGEEAGTYESEHDVRNATLALYSEVLF